MYRILLFFAIVLFGAYHHFSNQPSEVSAREIDASCDIVVFTTATCPYCTKARKLLDKEKVAWCEKDVEKSYANRDHFDDLGGRGVPLAVIGSEIIHGYNPREYRTAIKNM